jgi:hypothetical protein
LLHPGVPYYRPVRFFLHRLAARAHHARDGALEEHMDPKPTKPTIVHEIGTAAGHIYKYLHDNGEVSMNRLKKELSTELGRGRVDQALGWLAREEKIRFTLDKRTTRVSLRDR